MNFSNTKLFACGEEGGDVAGLVRWDERNKFITWVNPGGRQRAYDVAEVLEDTDDRFKFIDSEGRRFELAPLTPAFYNQRVRRARDPHLMTDDQLLAAFEKSLA
jgi:hypothetical protein